MDADEPQVPASQIGFGELLGAKGHNVSISVSTRETPSEATFRREEAKNASRSRRLRANTLFFSAVAAIFILGGCCLYVAFFSNHPTEEKKWAMGVLGTIVGALVTAAINKSGDKGED